MFRRKLLLVLSLILAVSASSSVWAQQFARPDATTDAAGWSVVGAADHHSALNEASADDNDYIDSGNGNNSTVILGLSNVSDPGTYANNHILRYRCLSSGTGGPERCNAALFEGATEIANNGNNSAVRGTFTLFEFVIPDASGITDYTNLNIHLISTSLGGGESIQISWAELEVPSATGTPPTVITPTFADVTDTTATLGGDVTDAGTPVATDRGVEWGTTPGGPWPNSVAEGLGGGAGIFTVPVTGLSASSTIYFRAWADNGTVAFSAESSFTTLATVVVPTVTADAAADITDTTATLGGNVTADGGGTVTDRGIVWNTSSPAETGGTIISMGSGTGPFSNAVSSLPPGTLIYFRAYATNSAGTSYSTEDSFNTLAGLPTVDTPLVQDITATSATLGGNVSGDGGSAVTSRGIVWNTSSPPETGGTVVPMGSGLGSFSNTVGGLPTDTLVYFRAYATNSAGTAYSVVDSFTPTAGAGTEPTVQASNITFTNVAGRSLRISWTRGDGDGSIVIMREDPPNAKVDPADNVDYVANPDYTLATELPTQNFVVYKGLDNFLLVSGLVESTTYSIAIYEYRGTGTSTDYLQLNPAEASQATTNMPVHNDDNRIDCGDCHNHGAFGARDTELKAVCETCHNPSGVAAAKLEFDNHLTPSKNPAVDFVDCGMCHELHNPGGANTVESFNNVTLATQNNKSFLRANVDKYVTTAVAPAYLHTDQALRVDPHPDAPQAAITPDRAVEGGTDAIDPSTDEQARGYCQVCHTMTSYHTNNPGTSGSIQTHDGGSNTSGLGTEVNCGTCHQHNNQFTPEGGSCVACHDSQQGSIPRPIITTQFDRFSSHITGGSGVVTQDDCVVCHDQSSHTTQTVRLWDVDDHANSFAQPTPGDPTTNTGEGEAFAGNCLSCHEDGVAGTLPASGSDQTQTSPFTGSGAPPVIDPTGWSTASHNRPIASFASPMTCVGDGINGCHGSGHGSEQQTLLAPAAVSPAGSVADFCYTCHSSGGLSGIDVQAQFALLDAAPNIVPVTSGSGAVVDNLHDLAVVNCANCHSPHIDNSTNPVADPDTALPLATYSTANSYTEDSSTLIYDSGSNLDPVNPEGATGGPYSQTDYIQFCLTCHDGTTPAGITMTANMVNIATAYDGTDQHGSGDGETGNRTGKGALKMPWVTSADNDVDNDPSAPYAALNCTTCHGAHGSENIFNLRTSITVAGQVMRIGGVGNMPVPTRITDTAVYTLPPLNGTVIDETNGVQTDHYWGAWCSFCHKMDAHPGKVEEDSCTGAHMHGGGSF